MTDPKAPREGLARSHIWRGVFRTRVGLVGTVLTASAVLTALLANLIAPHDPFRSSGPPLSPPSWHHLMGTDDLGRDVLSGVVYGVRPSLLVMAAAIAIASVIGITVGSVAALRGGVVDDLLMRVTEVFQSLPRFFLALLVVALFGQSLGLIALVLGLTTWPRTARVVRGEILSLRRRGFVEASRALGASERWILLRHLLPNALPSTVVVIALLGAHVILLEASLRFLGLGDPTTMSWGSMIRNGQTFLRSGWWMTTFPGLAIVATVVGINLLADALNDLLDPLREQRALGRTQSSARPPLDPSLLVIPDDAPREAEVLPKGPVARDPMAGRFPT